MGKSFGNVLDAFEVLVGNSKESLLPREIAHALNLDPKNPSHMSSVSRYLRKLRERGVIEKDKTGGYRPCVNGEEIVEDHLRESGEVRKKQAEIHQKDRIMHAYGLALKEAARSGESLEDVPVPKEIRESEERKILKKERERNLGEPWVPTVPNTSIRAC